MMWWLDDKRFRGDWGDRRPFLLRTTVSLPPQSSSTSAARRGLGLTDAEKAANHLLLEVASDQEAEREVLCADVKALEQGIRQQKAERLELEARFEQRAAEQTQRLADVSESSARALDQLRRQHACEMELLHQRLITTQQAASERERWFADSVRDCQRLRNTLASTEQRVIQKDSELNELETRLDHCVQDHAQALSEADYKHAIESKRLRAIIAEAECRAAERKALLTKLTADLNRLRATQLAEMRQLRECYRTKREQIDAKLHDAERRNLAQQSQITQLTGNVRLLREENERVRCQFHAASIEQESAEEKLRQCKGEHEVETDRLRSEISSLRAELDRCVAEQHALVASLKRVQSEHADSLSQHQNKLARAEDLLQQHAADASRQRQRADEFEQLAARQELENDELKMTLQRERQTYQNDKENFRMAQETNECEAARLRAAKSSDEREIAVLRQALEHQRKTFVDHYNRSQVTEWKLVAQGNARKKLADQLRLDAAELRAKHGGEIARLAQSLAERQRELESLWNASELTTRELERTRGALERKQWENEKLAEAQQSRYTSLQSRIEDLIRQLDVERSERTTADKEAKRLRDEQSGRIALLNQQREQLTIEVEELREQNHRISKQVSRVRATAATIARWLKDANEQLVQQTAEIERLRAEAETRKVDAAQAVRDLSSELIDGRKEIEQLTVQAQQLDRELRDCQQQLESKSNATVDEELLLAIAERDRVIARLEKNAAAIQQRLQREAAGRRKAEGAIKRQAKASDPVSAAHETWVQIEANDQVVRLQRQVEALRNMNLLERRRLSDEIQRYKHEVERIKRTQQAA